MGELMVEASNARETTTGAESRRGRGVDVDVRITFPNGKIVEGEVTLLPAEDGRHAYERWGDVQHWIDSATVDCLSELRRDEGANRYIEALVAIEYAAAACAMLELGM